MQLVSAGRYQVLCFALQCVLCQEHAWVFERVRCAPSLNATYNFSATSSFRLSWGLVGTANACHGLCCCCHNTQEQRAPRMHKLDAHAPQHLQLLGLKTRLLPVRRGWMYTPSPQLPFCDSCDTRDEAEGVCSRCRTSTGETDSLGLETQLGQTT